MFKTPTIAVAFFLVFAASESPKESSASGFFFYAGEGHTVEVEVRLGPVRIYRGERFEIERNGRLLCLSLSLNDGKCSERFFGIARSVALKFKVNGQGPKVLRERVTLIRQSAGQTGHRSVVIMEVPILHGVASDLQAYGFDEALLPKNQVQLWRKDFAESWKEFRQELFLDSALQPFAIILWRHTPVSIEAEVFQKKPADSLSAAR